MNIKNIKLHPRANKDMVSSYYFLEHLENIIGDEVADNYFEPAHGDAADDYLLISAADVKLLKNVIKWAEKGFKKAELDCYKEYYTELIKMISDRIDTLVESSLL